MVHVSTQSNSPSYKPQPWRRHALWKTNGLSETAKQTEPKFPLRAISSIYREMAFYADEEEVWKCPKHPSKRRKYGICAICLRERLVTLCPDCANVRPCGCCATTSSSSSVSSSFSLFSGDGTSKVSYLIESEPSFRRSRSVAIPFLRSRSRFVGGDRNEPPSVDSRGKASPLWSVFKFNKSKRGDTTAENEKKIHENEEADAAAIRKTMMMKSRSVAVTNVSESQCREAKPPKGRSWYFPSPIKVFRQSKISKVVQERSSVCI